MQRWQRFNPSRSHGVAWLLVPLAWALATCGGQPGVLVDIGSWPDQAASLRVDGALNGAPFTGPLFFGNGTTRFVVYLSEGDSGQLSLDLAALDGSGCPRATAQTQIEVGSGLRRVAEAVVMMTAVAPPTSMPRLDRITPALGTNAAATSLTLTGSNFACGAAVSVGGVACSNLSVVSSTQITCTLPARPGTCGTQTVSVTNPGTTSAASGTLFRFLSSALAFGSPSPLTTGRAPDHILALDVDGDGKLDLVNNNEQDNNVNVFPGIGDGTFGTAKPFGVGMVPAGLASGDFDGNKKPDLVTANFGSGSVSLLLNDGTGGFSMARDTKVGNSPRGIAVGDVDVNGTADVVVANSGDGTVSVLLGDGNGNLTVKSTPTVGSGPFDVALGDLDGDGYPDLTVTNYNDGTISFLHGNHDGTFTSVSTLAIGTVPIGLGVADVNSDGDLDIVASSGGTSLVYVMLGDGKGHFGTPKTSATGATPREVVIQDIDGDGVLDIVTANQDNANLSVLLGKGDGTFTNGSPYNFTVGAGGTQPFQPAAGDFNRDGIIDLASVNRGNNTLSVLLAQCQ